MLINIIIIGFCLAGIIFGAILISVGARSFKEKKLIEKIPASKIGNLTDGLAEISGVVNPCSRELLTAPLTNHECVYYKYTIEEYHPEHSVIKWETIRSGEEKSHFYLKDDTGSILIDPYEAAMNGLSADYEFETSFTEDPPENIKHILRKNDIDYEGFFGLNRKVRFKESMIVPGERLFILGAVLENPFIKDSASDKNRAALMTGKGNDVYLISDKPEKETVKTAKWSGIVSIAGGVIILITCVLLALLYFKIISLK